MKRIGSLREIGKMVVAVSGWGVCPIPVFVLSSLFVYEMERETMTAFGCFLDLDSDFA